MISIKKIKKVAVVFVGVIVGLYLLIRLVGGIYINSKKDSILAQVRTELSDKLRGKVTVGDLEISVWRHFPAIRFTVNDFSISDSVYNKPLLSAKKLSTTFQVIKLFSSIKTINNVIIEDASFHLFKDSTGYNNDYLLKPKKEDNKPGKKKDINAGIEINELEIENLAVTIEGPNKEISLVVNELSASIEQLGGAQVGIEMEEKITMKKGLGFNLEKGAYLENHTLEGEWELKMDKITQTLSFDKTNIKINDHPFELSGAFSFSKTDPAFKIAVHTDNLLFENAQKIVTNAIKQKISVVQIKGPLTVDANIGGSLKPGQGTIVNVNWKTENSTLVTPVASFTECSFEGNFMNSVNKDSLPTDPNSRITFKTFNGNWGGIKLAGKDISITNLMQPIMDFDFYSNCTFQALDEKFALKDISFVSGTTDLHLSYSGPLTKDMSMLQDLEGELNVKNGVILYVPTNFNFTNCSGQISFSKDSINMRKFTCQYLKNKLEVEVNGTNISRKFIVGDLSQEAIVKCNIRSSYINLEDFKPLFAAPKQKLKVNKPSEGFKGVATKLDNILVNSVIGVQVKVAEVKFQNMLATDFDADIKFHPHHWELAKISLNLSGGSIVTTGKIMRAADGNHAAELTVKMDDLDVKKLLYAFDNFGQDAITHEHLSGIFFTNASLKAGISNQGKIIPSSIHGTVDFSLKNGALQNFPPLMNLKTFVFKDRDMTDVRFAEIKDRLEIKGTEIYVNRMEIQSTVIRLFLEGNYGLTGKNTEMLIQVPLSNLSDKSFETDDGEPENKGTKAKAGTSVWLRAENDADGKVKVKYTVKKKFKNEKVEEKSAAKRA